MFIDKDYHSKVNKSSAYKVQYALRKSLSDLLSEIVIRQIIFFVKNGEIEIFISQKIQREFDNVPLDLF